MKRILPIFLLGLLAFGVSGCRTQYDIVLQNGASLQSVGKPKYDEETGYYAYKDALGNTKYIQRMRVKLIQPSSYSVEDEED
jgi:hypothetical protein